MFKIVITKKDGKQVSYELTPSVKVAFESHFKVGWRKRLNELELESDLWWLAHALEKAAGKTDKDLGDEYINQYQDVDIVVDSKNG